MKVLMLAKFLRKDGATTHIFTLAKGLSDKGHEVHILSGGAPEDERSQKLFDEFFTGEIKHHKIGFPNYARFDFFSKIVQLLMYIIYIPYGIYIIKKINTDIIHVHYPVTSYIEWIYCKIYRKKFVTTYHIKGIPNQILHRKANKAIAISSEMVLELKERWHYSDGEVAKVFNGINEKRFNQDTSDIEREKIKKELNIPTHKKVLGFVGSYEYKKGIDLLIKACSRLPRDKFCLVLVGDGDQDYVNDSIENYNMNLNVYKFHFQDPIQFYKIFDVFILPSRNEGFGLVAVEAMMMGVTTIRSNVSGAYDMIQDKKTGYIFESENDIQLTDIIVRVLNSDDETKHIAKRGKEFVINNFTEERMVDNMIKVYQSLL